MILPQLDHHCPGWYQQPVAPLHLPLAWSPEGFPPQIESHQLPHPDQHHSTAPATLEMQVSVSQREMQRLLAAAAYAQSERALLIQALEGLCTAERQPLAPWTHPREQKTEDCSAAPVLMRDQGGLFRLLRGEQAALQAEPQPALAPKCLFSCADTEPLDDLDSDHFRMFRFKVQLCRESRCHDWAQCPYAHPGEKAARRDPRVHRYLAVPCPDVKRSGKCTRGDACSMAHGVFECWLHPSRYRTQPCKDGALCRRAVCFFAHSQEQLRLAPAAAAAIAADSALGNAKSQEEDCQSPGHRPRLKMLPGGMSSNRASSPFSVLSPAASSPPPSPPLGTSPHSRTGIHCQDRHAQDYGYDSSPRCSQQARPIGPAFCSSPVQPQLLTGPVPFGPGLFDPALPRLQQQRQYLSPPTHLANTRANSHVVAGSHWGNHQLRTSLSDGATLSRPKRICDEEPDLSWVTDLVR